MKALALWDDLQYFRSKNEALRNYGNKAADVLAREAASWHPAAPEVKAAAAS